MKTIKEYPITDRPYEKCFANGAAVLSDTELLSVILRTGTNGQNVQELSAQILSSNCENKGLLSIMHLTKEQLLEMKGIGRVKACQILCIAELVKRISKTKAHLKLQFDNPSTIAGYYMERLRHLEQEHLYVLYLDTKCNLIKEQLLTTGSINQSLISNREIFLEALRCSAVQFVLIHNHPSGDSSPSKNDISATLNLAEAGKLIGIQLIDHIIIGDMKFCSLRELKILK